MLRMSKQDQSTLGKRLGMDSHSLPRNPRTQDVRKLLPNRYRTLCSLIILSLVLAMGAIAPIAAQTAHFITVAWTYTQGTDLATGFNVYRSTTTGGPYAKLTTTPLSLTTLSYQDTGGNGGTKYYYVVTAIDSGGVESVNSSEASATFIASSPNAPTGATATAH